MMTQPIPKIVAGDGQSEPLHLMKTALTEINVMHTILAHHVKMYRSLSVECVLEFPEGTFIHRHGLSAHQERYVITLPDGFQLRVVWSHDIFLLLAPVNGEDEDDKGELPVV